MFLPILEQSSALFPLILGIYISYNVLRIADLTTDGTFVLGAGLFGIFVNFGMSPLVAMFFATLGGVAAGALSGFLQTRLQINPLICGILLVFILNTLTLKMMGKPNLSLFDRPSIFFSYPKLAILISMALFFLLSGVCLLSSKTGLMLHAFGNNPTLLQLCGKSEGLYRILGLSLSNGLVAYSGALTAQLNGYADIGMGTGMILIALGIVIIGNQIYNRLFQNLSFTFILRLTSCFFAALFYFTMVHSLLSLGCDPIYLRLMIGICLIAFLGITQEKNLKKAIL